MSKPEFLQYGGLAVMEGVMMRSPRYYAVACRAPSGEIVLHQDEVPGGGVYGKPWYKVPVLRGALAIWDMLFLGIRALNFSAKVQLGEVKPSPSEGWEARDGAGEGAKRGVTSPEGSQVVFLKPQADSFGTKAAIGGALVAGLAVAVLLFVVGPTWIAEAFRFLGVRGSVALNWIEGLVKVLIFLSYIGLLGLVKDIREVYKYHGAEHKTINALEAEAPLTLESVRQQSRLHPRCGTSFAIVVLVLLVFCSAFLPRDYGTGVLALDLTLRVLAKLLLVPIIGGVVYEVIRWAGRLRKNALFRALVWPGMQTQYLTTREPEDSQLEVALVALRAVLDREAEFYRATAEAREIPEQVPSDV
jgi:uncharacterized protein YqhQ